MSQTIAPVISINSGDHRAQFFSRRDHLVTTHLDLARSIARNIHAQLPPSFDLEDLIQTGCVALIEAATRYRPKDHGETPFSAYARLVVRGAILESVRRKNYSAATMAEMPAAEPAAEPEMELQIDRERVRMTVRRAVSYLSKRQGAVLQLYYGGSEGKRYERITFAQIGEKLGCSATTASQLHATALATLRHAWTLKKVA